MGHTKDCADIQKPNRRSAMQNAWTRVVTKEPALIVSQAAAPAVLYYIRSCEQPTADAITSAEVQVGRLGIGLLDRPGIWYVYWVAPATVPVKEPFVIRPVKDPATALAFMQLNALAQAFDLVRWGGTALSAARDASTDAKFAKADIGGLVNARAALYREAAGDWSRVSGDTPNAVAGEAHNSYIWQRAAALAVARDTGDNTLRLIEARAAVTAQAAALYRLQTQALCTTFDVINSNVAAIVSVPVESGYGTPGVLGARETGYWSAFRGRRFLISGEGTAIAFTNGFTATIPQIILVAGATNEFIVRRIKVSLSIVPGTPPGLMRVVLDTANRYSSGGTARTPFNMNGGSATATTLAQAKDGAAAITATAAGGGTREMGTTVVKTLVGEPYIRELEDGLIVPSSGSLLLYLYAGDTAGRFHYEIEGEEANVQ